MSAGLPASMDSICRARLTGNRPLAAMGAVGLPPAVGGLAGDSGSAGSRRDAGLFEGLIPAGLGRPWHPGER
jgi:hypothetical protein